MISEFNQDIFLKNDKNKSQFISFLSDQLRREDLNVHNSNGDTDSQIVSKALKYAFES